jgi:hypothetical protein
LNNQDKEQEDMKNVRRSISMAVSCCVMVSLSIFSGGCTTPFGTTRLVVAHAPLAPVAQKRQGDVIVRPFVDKRERTAYIGNKRHGFGMVSGHVATHKGVKIDELLTQYFIEALRQAGYNAVLEKTIQGSGAPQLKCDAIIDGEIVEFLMDYYSVVWHRVGVNVKAINPADQKVIWERLIQGTEKRVLWLGAKGEFERIVREAITKALDRAAQEFASDNFYDRAIKKQL